MLVIWKRIHGISALTPGNKENVEELKILLRPAKKVTPGHYPVSKDVGKVSNDGEYLLALSSE